MSRTIPTTHDLATELEHLARELRRDGPKAHTMARLLEERGFSSASGASGGSHGNSELTPTEAAAARPNHWTGTRAALYDGYRDAYRSACNLRDTIGRILSHGDIEATARHNRQPGSGPCMACTRDVPGTSTDRLRSGFCNACRMRWTREGRPDRAAFIRRRLAEVTPPEPEHVDPTQHPATT